MEEKLESPTLFKKIKRYTRIILAAGALAAGLVCGYEYKKEILDFTGPRVENIVHPISKKKVEGLEEQVRILTEKIGKVEEVSESKSLRIAREYNGNKDNIGIIQELESEKVNYPFNFVLFADTHINDGSKVDKQNLEMLLKNAERFNPKFGIAIGDTTENGSFKEYFEYTRTIDKANFQVITLIGNHEYFQDSNGDKFNSLFNRGERRDLYFDYGNWRFLLLDNKYELRDVKKVEKGKDDYFFSLTELQLSWLREKLKGNEEKQVLVAMHGPPRNSYSKTINGKYTVIGYQGDFFNANNFFRNSDEFMRLIEGADVEISASGHEHLFANYERNRTRYLGVYSYGGGVGLCGNDNPPNDGNFHHFIIVSADKNSYVGRVIGADGKEKEEYRFDERVKEGGLIPLTK